MQYIELSLAAAFQLPREYHYRARRPREYHYRTRRPILKSRPAGAVMIFTGSRNAAASDNSMYCMIPDPFPSTAFGKGSATPDYLLTTSCQASQLSVAM